MLKSSEIITFITIEHLFGAYVVFYALLQLIFLICNVDCAYSYKFCALIYVVLGLVLYDQDCFFWGVYL
jgi:hypothetical protein